jgi:hypothetical protein
MRVFADSMRRVAVVALLVVSGHVAASNIWLEQASREVVAGWPRIEKGFTPTLFKGFQLFKMSGVLSGRVPRQGVLLEGIQ